MHGLLRVKVRGLGECWSEYFNYLVLGVEGMWEGVLSFPSSWGVEREDGRPLGNKGLPD